MKILQICYKPPFPLVDGGTIGMHSLTMGLLNTGNEVKVLTFYSYKHPCDITKLPKDYVKATNIETVFADLRVKALPALWCFLTNKSYHVKRFVNKAMKEKLKAILSAQEFDTIQLESIFLAPYISLIRQYSKAKIVLRAPNIEHLIWLRTAQKTHNPLKRLYLFNLALTLKHFELKSINSFDGVYPVTKIDADFFITNGCKVPCVGVPVGVQSLEDTNDIKEEEDSLFHIGSMDWIPNQQGILWFLDKVWDTVHSKFPNIKLYLAGRAMPSSFYSLNKEGVNIVGRVDSSERFIASKQIMIVPLLAGSGIRIKILEAMNLGKCIIATPQAAEGIDYTNGKNIIIASSPLDFSLSIQKCLTDKTFTKNIGNQAKILIKEKYNINAIATCLTSLYKQLK